MYTLTMLIITINRVNRVIYLTTSYYSRLYVNPENWCSAFLAAWYAIFNKSTADELKVLFYHVC